MSEGQHTNKQKNKSCIFLSCEYLSHSSTNGSYYHIKYWEFDFWGREGDWTTKSSIITDMEWNEMEDVMRMLMGREREGKGERERDRKGLVEIELQSALTKPSERSLKRKCNDKESTMLYPQPKLPRLWPTHTPLIIVIC